MLTHIGSTKFSELSDKLNTFEDLLFCAKFLTLFSLFVYKNGHFKTLYYWVKLRVLKLAVRESISKGASLGGFIPVHVTLLAHCVAPGS